jgi:tetratricopeptide (TPR) repeat protein
LLPHDRTREQRLRERSELALLSIPAAWAPPLFAALVAGLQLTFWEHATAATGEMLDLLLFAYVVRCLLEYRLSEEDKWLSRCALVYGLGITNNYAMIGFFPAFIVALIWIRGRRFFEFRFLARMMGWGAAGVTLYLLLPVLSASSAHSELKFWDALRLQLVSQKNSLLLSPARSVAFWAALTSLLPLTMIGLRWPSSFGDTSVIGSSLTNLMFRLVHGVLLAACIWVALDAPFSARSLVDRRLIQRMDESFDPLPFLSFYYLGALCVGYFVGYCLLVFGREAVKTRQRVSGATRLVNWLVTAAVWIGLIAVPLAMLRQNLPSIRSTNGSFLSGFARSLARSLPAEGAILLADYPHLLSLVELHLRGKETAPDHLLVDTSLLPYPAYQQLLHKRCPSRWPQLPPAPSPHSRIDPAFLMQEIGALTLSNAVYYLHPSFGYYFEPLHLRPHGVAYRMHFYPTNTVAPPPLSPEELEENRAFWKQAEPILEQLRRVLSSGGNDARVLGRWYSRALNNWGVELQRNGHPEEAARSFDLATQLNPANIAAEVNRTFNAGLRAGKPEPVEVGKTIEDKFGSRYRSWNAVLAANGPIDEPAFCFRLGQALVQESLFRQAAVQFLRVIDLEPSNLEAAFSLANVYLQSGAPDKALEAAAQLRARQASRPLPMTNQIELVRIEAMAHYSAGRFEKAEDLLLNARRQYPEDATLPDTLVQLYLLSNQLTNAFATVEQQLKIKSDDVRALLNKTLVCMRMEAYDKASNATAAILRQQPNNALALLNQGAIAIQTKAYREALPPLNQVLKLQPENRAALMNRAIANLQSDQLDDAQRDYEELQKAMPNLHSIYYGLGEIAYRRKNGADALKHYETYLKYAPPDTDEYKAIKQRLKELRSTAH